jgi:flagellar motor switch protein FliM
MGALVDIARAGAQIQGARKALEHQAPRFVSALRKALPFLGRPGHRISVRAVSAGSPAAACEGLTAPYFMRRFTMEPSGERGLVLLDAKATALLVDGVLGGTGAQLIGEGFSKITPARKTLLNRAIGGFLSLCSEITHDGMGSTVATDSQDADDAEAGLDAAMLLVVLEVAGPSTTGTLLVALPQLRKDDRTAPPPAMPAQEDRMARALEGAPLEVTLELGRSRHSLQAVSELKVGSLLLFEAKASDGVVVRCGAHVLGAAVPIADESDAVSVRLVQLSSDG